MQFKRDSMKKIIIGSLILFAVVTSFYGCRKNDNPKLPEGIETGIFPQLDQDESGDVLIQEVNEFKSSFNVGLYYPTPVPQKMDLRVTMNDNYVNVKTLKADITTYPTKVDVTGPQLAQLFGRDPESIVPGEFFTISPDITRTDGKVLQAFTYGVNGTDTFNLAPYGSDALNTPGSNPIITYTKVCTLFMDSVANVEGGGKMVVQDKDVVQSDYPVVASVVGDDVIKLTNYCNVPGAVLNLKIIKKSQTITIAKQFIAAKVNGPDITGYTNWYVTGKGSVNACDNSLSLTLTFSVDQGSFLPVTQKIVRPE